MASFESSGRGFRGGGLGGLNVPPTPDLWALLAVIFVTYSLQFSPLGGLASLLRLSSEVWQTGFVWQLVSYPFIGSGNASVWILLELLILYWFAGDIRRQLGRKRFWNLLWLAALIAGIAAVAIDALQSFTLGATSSAFVLMQGQRTLIVIVIAAFALMRREATILLFFVLPVKAKWFIWIEIAFAWIGFLGSGDLPGFIGVCVAVLSVFVLLQPRRARGLFREPRLRLERWWIQRKLAGKRKKRGFTVVRGDGDRSDRSDDVKRGPWVN